MAVENDPPVPSSALAVLVENHRAFLRYLERRVGDRALAEDILQEAFVRNLEKVERLPDQAVVPWFYRTLTTRRLTPIAVAAVRSGRWKRSRVNCKPQRRRRPR